MAVEPVEDKLGADAQVGILNWENAVLKV